LVNAFMAGSPLVLALVLPLLAEAAEAAIVPRLNAV
jgi:hypothetical protein